MTRVLRTVSLPKTEFLFAVYFTLDTRRNVCYVPEDSVELDGVKGPLAIITTIVGEPVLKTVYRTKENNMFISAVHCTYGSDYIFNGYRADLNEVFNGSWQSKISYASTVNENFEKEISISLPAHLKDNLAINSIVSDRNNKEVYFCYEKISGEHGIIVVDEISKKYKRDITLTRPYNKLVGTTFQTMYALHQGEKGAFLIDTQADKVEKVIIFPSNVGDMVISYVGALAVDNKNGIAYFVVCGKGVSEALGIVVLKYSSATGEYIGVLDNSQVDNFMVASIVVDEKLQRLYVASSGNVILCYDLKESIYSEKIVLSTSNEYESIGSMMMNFNSNRLVVTTNDQNENGDRQPCKVHTITEL